MLAWNEAHADILVVGGSLTGLEAAIHAKKANPSLQVLVLDKGKAGRSGCANWGGGDVACETAEDPHAEIRQRYLDLGDGLCDPGWLEMVLSETFPRVMEMAEWGVPFERDAAGALLRKEGRSGGALSVVCRGATILAKLRSTARRAGVMFMDKVMITDLLAGDGQVTGAVGFRVGTDALEPCRFHAPSVVLAAGPCSFKAAYIGHRMATGDGVMMAYRAGAAVVGMEFAVAHNSGPRDFDLSGMARFVAMGGKFLNGLNEEFMWRYHATLGNKAPFATVLLGMAREVREGRGPIYFDLTAIRPEDLELSRRILPFTFLALDRMGFDFRRDRLEWIPCLAGNRASAAGVAVEPDMSTAVKGLFAGGDTAMQYFYGANGGYQGMSFAWCAISGSRAGRSAARYAAGQPLLPQGDAGPVEERLLHPLAGKGIKAQEATEALQDILVPYDVIILKEEGRLRAALSRIYALLAALEDVAAADVHDLVKAHEVRNMARLGEMVLQSSLLRTESRGMHYREDFPNRDDNRWKQWLSVSEGKGERQYCLGWPGRWQPMPLYPVSSGGVPLDRVHC